jgi:hypothetical protein
MVKHDSIPVFPHVPKAEEPKHGGSRAGVNLSGQLAGAGIGNAHGGSRGAAQRPPEGDGEGALKEGVHGSLQGRGANGTPASSLVDNAFLRRLARHWVRP